jgi:hypothetical protein
MILFNQYKPIIQNTAEPAPTIKNKGIEHRPIIP